MKMFKAAVILLCITFYNATVLAFPSIIINGIEISPPKITEESIILPVREICDLAGNKIDWNKENRIVTIYGQNKKSILNLMDNKIVIYDKKKHQLKSYYDNSLGILNGVTVCDVQTLLDCLDGSFISSKPQLKTEIQIPESKYQHKIEDELIFSTSKVSFQLMDDIQSIYNSMGYPQRTDVMNDNFKWHIYNIDLKDFMMVGEKDSKIVAVYSNSKNFLLNGSYIDSQDQVLYALEKVFPEYYYKVYSDPYKNECYGLYVRHSEVVALPIEYNNANLDAMADQIIDITNSLRVKYGIAALKKDKIMTTSAKNHSLDMAERNYFDHTTPEGKSELFRMINAGLVRFSMTAENIAFGFKSSYAAVGGWIEAFEHRNTILNNNLKFIGVGVAADQGGMLYFTQNYYSPPDWD